MADLALSGWLDAQRDRITASLFDWLRIPSVSADPDHAGDVRASAEFCAGLLRDAGLEHVQLLETPGHPAVYGDWLHAGPDAPTVLVYGHHDVQPVDPLDEWTSPPWTPVIVDGECRARGAIDDKGQVLYQIEAARGLLETTGTLPVNLKLLIEGEEEHGSVYFEDLLHQHLDLLAADVVVVSDTGMLAEDVPSATVSMRGVLGFELKVRTASIDLHSGSWGGTVPNAARLIGELAAALHDEHHRVTIPGFYDRVAPLSPEEQASLDAQPWDEDAYRAQAGGVPYLEGEEGYRPIERTGVRPTAEIVGISGGYTGPGIKTIVPATAGMKIALRLVPDQQPDEIETGVRRWVDETVPEGVEVSLEIGGGVAPARTPIDHPAVGALRDAIAAVWGAPPLWTREGGSGPEEALGRVIDAPVLFLGVGLPGDRIHAPNERMVLTQFWRGLLAAAELHLRLAKTGAAGAGA